MAKPHACHFPLGLFTVFYSPVCPFSRLFILETEKSKHLVSSPTQSKGSIVTSYYCLNASEKQAVICSFLNPFYNFLFLFIRNSSFSGHSHLFTLFPCQAEWLPSTSCPNSHSHVLGLCRLVCELIHSFVHLTSFSATWCLSCHFLMETFPDP